MLKIKSRRILAFFGVVVLAIGGYVGWQIYQGQQMANQYATDAQKFAQGSGNGLALPNPNSPPPSSSDGTTSSASSGQTSPSSLDPQSPGSQANSSTSTPTSKEYKQLMSSTYQQTLQAMQNVKSTTLALQGKSLSLSSYKASILQSQATFGAAEAFVRAHPPTEEALNPYYQEFLAGISLANQSMGVILKGISSFSPSSFYAAREMGKAAQQQLVNGYSHL